MYFPPRLPRRHEALPLLLLLMKTNGTSPNGMYKYSRIRAAKVARNRDGLPDKKVRSVIADAGNGDGGGEATIWDHFKSILGPS